MNRSLSSIHRLFFYGTVLFVFSLSACTVSKKISKLANHLLLEDSLISTGHIGICIYEPTTGKYLYHHNEKQYFLPASNTKIFTCYAAMKYLGDSVAGLKYTITTDSGIIIQPTGDPSFLHPGFLSQPVYDFLKGFKKIYLNYPSSTFTPMAKGWTWEDYQESFMVQRNAFPIYGNLMRIYQKDNSSVGVIPSFFKPEYPMNGYDLSEGFNIHKSWDSNQIMVSSGHLQRVEIPFTTSRQEMQLLLEDTLHLSTVQLAPSIPQHSTIYSRPLDSLLKKMMFNSDNFLAEQTLLMVSNTVLKRMSDQEIIDTLLANDFFDIPQKPVWIDGSGLSRYNLQTPQSIVYLLNKIQHEFGINRVKKIFPTGGQGTLKALFHADSSFIYAKTGSMRNNLALSGYLLTKTGKWLNFCIIVNSFQGPSGLVRRAFECFLDKIREKL